MLLSFRQVCTLSSGPCQERQLAKCRKKVTADMQGKQREYLHCCNKVRNYTQRATSRVPPIHRPKLFALERGSLQACGCPLVQSRRPQQTAQHIITTREHTPQMYAHRTRTQTHRTRLLPRQHPPSITHQCMPTASCSPIAHGTIPFLHSAPCPTHHRQSAVNCSRPKSAILRLGSALSSIVPCRIRPSAVPANRVSYSL